MIYKKKKNENDEKYKKPNHADIYKKQSVDLKKKKFFFF